MTIGCLTMYLGLASMEKSWNATQRSMVRSTLWRYGRSSFVTFSTWSCNLSGQKYFNHKYRTCYVSYVKSSLPIFVHWFFFASSIFYVYMSAVCVICVCRPYEMCPRRDARSNFIFELQRVITLWRSLTFMKTRTTTTSACWLWWNGEV